MAINPETLQNWSFTDVQHAYTERDTILYALGLGLGRDPMDAGELAYVYEQDLKVIPTFAVTLATLGLWVKDPATGITWQKLVHSGQSATFYQPLPARAEVRGAARISAVYDRGPEKGAVIVVERSIFDAQSGACYCKLEQTLMLRADGGFGGAPPPANDVAIPATPAAQRITYQSVPGQAILYRLSGDWNPLHIDPQIAQAAGFSRPILHGYCSYGIAGWVACQAADRNTDELESLQCQFSGPVLPGDELDFHFWHNDAGELLFRADVKGRTVLNRGRATFR
ncbi:MAG: 3-alpha,7-alpha,12-alpha-trihydroxy-5-beta-cholest-24-enoyl-CoA hydratase [Gammaproteobacteria bacterium]|nr:3-alpha,7-alpha,12-alpha-trihydroxy-5-beta-cholest-24-enoyl-CoA hydratase [Gammaproteobacteria bacterium]